MNFNTTNGIQKNTNDVSKATNEGKTLWETCIIGGGIIGSATAYSLASAGCNGTVLLEQFPLPHTRGSSHGQSRVIRHSYGQKRYAEMMPECFKRWEELEKKTGKNLFKKCGLLSIDSFPLQAAKQVQKNLNEIGIDSLLLEEQEFNKKYPMLQYPNGTGAVLENEAGVLMANKCGQAYRDLFVQNGGVIFDNEKVVEIIPGDVIKVKTINQELEAKKVIITGGPWTCQLVRQLGLNLPLQPYFINVCYWKTTDERYRADRGFPTFGDFGSGTAKKCQIYGLPCIEYPDMLKICLHHGTKISPDSRDLASSLQSDVEEIANYIREHFRNVEDKPSIVEPCMYTSTPDDDFIIDRHPAYGNIVIGAGFSGHGFKLAPVVGKLLRELSEGQSPSYDLTPFRIQRFKEYKAQL